MVYNAIGMFNYKTDLLGITVDHPGCTRVISAEGASRGRGGATRAWWEGGPAPPRKHPAPTAPSPPHPTPSLAGHDLISLMFNFLDSCLFAFASDDFIARDFRVLSLVAPGVETGAPGEGAPAPEGEPQRQEGGAPAFSIRVLA